MGLQQSIRLTAIEESILLWEAASTPWNGHLDVSAPRLDPERLRSAYNAALSHHDLGPCGVQPVAGGRLAWVRSTAPVDIGPIEVVPCADDDEVEQVRAAQLERPMELARPPVARATIARRPHDDLLLSSVSHVLCDGVGIFRLLRSVGRAYTGTYDPAPARSILAAQRALVRPASTSLGAISKRWATAMTVAGATTSARSRVLPSGGAMTGCGVITRIVAAEAVRAARGRRGAAFDEFAVAAMHLTIDGWNRAGGHPADNVGVAFGVNLRQQGWVDDVVTNLATFVSVITAPRERVGFTSTLEAVQPQMAREVRLQRARVVIDAARASCIVPAEIRRQALQAARPDLFDSFALSNFGVLADPPRFGDSYEPEIWVSQPAVPEVGLAMCLFTLGDALRVTVRYRTERFDARSAGEFTDAFVATLIDL